MPSPNWVAPNRLSLNFPSGRFTGLSGNSVHADGSDGFPWPAEFFREPNEFAPILSSPRVMAIIRPIGMDMVFPEISILSPRRTFAGSTVFGFPIRIPAPRFHVYGRAAHGPSPCGNWMAPGYGPPSHSTMLSGFERVLSAVVDALRRGGAGRGTRGRGRTPADAWDGLNPPVAHRRDMTGKRELRRRLIFDRRNPRRSAPAFPSRKGWIRWCPTKYSESLWRIWALSARCGCGVRPKRPPWPESCP